MSEKQEQQAEHDPLEGTLEGCRRDLRAVVNQRNRLLEALSKIKNISQEAMMPRDGG